MWHDATCHHVHGMRAMCTTTWPNAWEINERVTPLMCHHHLVAYWEENISVEGNRKGKRKNGNKEKERNGKEGKRK